MGRRVIKTSQVAPAGGTSGPTTSTLYVYDQRDRLLGEYAAGGATPLREYVWLDDIPLAMLESDPANPTGAPRIYLVHADHLDTPRALLDLNNALRWRWLDEPFGAGLAEESPAGLPAVRFNLRMPGQVFDEESRLHYNFHRYYDPSTGRYTQSDPIGLQGGINTYAYVENQPTIQVDPEGLMPPGVDPDCVRRGECRCVTAECAAGIPPSPPPRPLTCLEKCMLKSLGVIGLSAGGRQAGFTLGQRYGGMAVAGVIGIAQSVWTPAAATMALPYLGFVADQCTQECGLNCEGPPTTTFLGVP